MKKRTKDLFTVRCAICGKTFETRALDLFLCRTCWPIYGQPRTRKRKKYDKHRR